MKEATRKWFGIIVVAAVSFGMAGCSAEPRAAGESGTRTEAVGERASAEGAGEHASAEGAGERSGAGEHSESEGGGEHGEGGAGGEHGSGGEEESGERIGWQDTWDATRNGARLILSFDAAFNAFVGTVENTTHRTLCAVRVEVHGPWDSRCSLRDGVKK